MKLSLLLLGQSCVMSVCLPPPLNASLLIREWGKCLAVSGRTTGQCASQKQITKKAKKKGRVHKAETETRRKFTQSDYKQLLNASI